MVEVDRENHPLGVIWPIADPMSSSWALHRIVMLDSAWDAGIVDDKIGGLLPGWDWRRRTKSPSSAALLTPKAFPTGTLAWSPMPFKKHPMGHSSSSAFTRHSSTPGLKHIPISCARRSVPRSPPTSKHIFVASIWKHALSPTAPPPPPRLRHPSWFAAEGQAEPTYVKRGDNDDLLDYGVSRGKANEMLRLIAGVGSRRPADVVLHGHVHRFNEFRIGLVDGEIAYFMDFYTHNPAHYYPTRFATSPPEPESDVTYVDVVDSALVNGVPTPMPYEAMHKYVVQVPPYPRPLATTSDVRAWWAQHRPLVLQSEALGPLKDSQVSFSGFRLLSVKGDLIEKIHFVSTQRLHESGYRLPWEEAIKPEPPRRHLYLQRSREHNSPEAAGAPYGYLAPVNGVHNIVYRDTQGRLMELWRDAGGATGDGNLTNAAQGTPAAGDPYVYLDTVTGLQIILYRGSDRNVHALYFSTGVAGHDDIGGAVGAPKAAGNPVGYFTPASNIHHVIYRKDDGHLHALWWTGAEAASHSDVTGLAGALPAAGDPSAIIDTARGENIVFYRASDGHIHDVYWSTGPAGHENLSGFAGAPQAAGDPFAFYTPHDDVRQVTYRGTDGHIHELYSAGVNPVSHWDLTAIASAPAAASDPVSFYSAHTNTKHVFYRATDGHVIELSWVPGGGTPAYVDLSLMALAPPAVGKPGAFATGPERHVVYRATDNHIHEIRWTPIGAQTAIDLLMGTKLGDQRVVGTLMGTKLV